LEITLGEKEFTIKPNNMPRAGWADASKKISKLGEDQLLIPDVFENENLDE
jgi:antitoxin MazE